MAGQIKYEIGQIIYILSNKTQTVIPAIVEEQVDRKIRRADGVHTILNYKLSLGPKERRQVVDLAKIDGEVYESTEQIKEVLIGRLTKFVDDLVKTTQKNVELWYDVNAEESTITNDKYDPSQLVHAMNNNLPLHGQNERMNPHLALRENIRNMVSEEESDKKEKMVILPDGTRVPVSL